jgi:TolB-like protein
MTNQPGRFIKFWQELKRRKVVKVIVIYASTTFILLQLISILIEPLHLPQWVMTLIIVLLALGFPIAIIFSWIFDVTSKGIEVTQTDDKSIAVLPFTNDSNDSSNIYIINGLMESILNNLAKIKDLRVLGRTSVEVYRNNPKLIPEIARELNVKYIVEGSGQKNGNQLFLTVQLLEAATDKHLWSEQYKKDAKDIFNLQIEASKTIADEIQAIITPVEKQRIEKLPTQNLTAWDFYLKSNDEWFSFWLTRNMLQLENAQNYLLKAIEFDHEFSLAYAQLGQVYYMIAHFSPSSSNNYWRKAFRVSKKAIEFDPENGLAYAVLGVVQSNWVWNSAEARISFERAIEFSPNEKQVFIDYLFFESRLGNCKGIKSNINILKNILSTNFTDAFTIDMLNFKLLSCQGKHKKMAQIAKHKELVSVFIWDHLIVNAFIQSNEFEKAMNFAEVITAQSVNPIDGLSQKGIIYAMKGDDEKALKVLSDLKDFSKSNFVSPIIFASVYAALNNNMKANEYLEQALKERDWRIHDIFEYAPFYKRRDEAWLKEIIRKSWIPINDNE